MEANSSTSKKPSPPAGSLERVLAGATRPHPVAPRSEDGQFIAAELDLLDDNPFQPRTAIDEAKLEELCSSLRQSGLIQPIAVRPIPGGRYHIVAGHRRVTAFRRLRDAAVAAGDEAEKRKWAAIRAQVMLALDDTKMAVGAYVENVQRADLNPVEEAAALVRIKELTGAKSAKELAQALSQNERRVRRLLQVDSAPAFIKAAVTQGVMVTLLEDGRERREKRELDLMTAVAFVRLYEHAFDRKPKTAEERVEAVVRRALTEGWGKRRIEEYVDGIVGGRLPDPDDDVAVVDGEAKLAPVYDRTAQRFVVHLGRLRSSDEQQRAALRAAIDALIAECAPATNASA